MGARGVVANEHIKESEYRILWLISAGGKKTCA